MRVGERAGGVIVSDERQAPMAPAYVEPNKRHRKRRVTLR